MGQASRYVLVALAAALVTLGSVWVGQTLRVGAGPETRLHAVLHNDLDLDPGQKKRIEKLEDGFAAKRSHFEGELLAANADLAKAISTEHGYGPGVEHAVDRSHVAMGVLQKMTLQHVFAMRGVLRPQQKAQFDKAVAEALTAPAED
ncbi:MAG: periplasmic heavy metal sensor [Sphingobium sp.]